MVIRHDEEGWCQGAGSIAEVSRRIIVRCPECRRRLLVQEFSDPEVDTVVRKIPPHKVRITKRRRT